VTAVKGDEARAASEKEFGGKLGAFADGPIISSIRTTH
jgi:hypothetical protein